MTAALVKPAVRDQLTLLRFRNTAAAFGFEAELLIRCPSEHALRIEWRREGARAILEADLQTFAFTVSAQDAQGEETVVYQQI